MPAIARVVRSDVTECVHDGSVVLLDPAGAVTFGLGDVDAPMFPRSSNKPLQAAGMVAAGLDLPPELLAVVCASHAGEQVHVDAVRRILAAAGLDESALACPEDHPGDPEANLAARCSGEPPRRVWMNCSGKHAGMVATCVAAGWPVPGYLDPAHPLQVALSEYVAALAGHAVGPIGVDGCGAPILGLPLTALARAFGRIAAAAPDTAEGRVAAAMRAHPLLVSGSRRPDRELAEGVPGLVAKVGAEGVYAAALPDGRAVALRVHDGADRARTVAMARALEILGVDEAVVHRQTSLPVTGGGRRVGDVEPAF